MDPDEYEYLERTTEEQPAKPPPPPPRDSRTSNGSADRSADRSEGKGSKRRRGDSPDGDREHSRRPSSEGDPRDRHRDRGQEPRHRSGSRDERGHRSSSERRERDGERERERRSRSRSERRYSEHDRERERRSRSRSERRYSEHDRERELRERDREGRRHKKEEAAEPEADPERDQRTVFAYQLPLKADERDVYEFFSRAGKVRDVRLIMDRNSRRSKGVGYIEFYDVMSVPMAIALSGQLLLGQPVMVKPSEAEKNLVPSSSASAALSGPYSGGARRLYVGNLHFSMTDDQLKQVFEPFGQVELVQLPRDPETGHCKGFGFIQFTRLEDAKAALNLNGQLDIAGRTIKVSSVTDQSGAQEVGATAADFDDDDGAGLALNACSRAMLMAKLDRTGTASSTLTTTTPALAATSGIALPAVVPPVVQLPGSSAFFVTPRAPLVEAIGTPSECLLLKNMFDPTIETEPDFDLDIKEDVQDECAKFGNLKHIFVDKDSSGFVYLRFENATSAIGAQRALHGRWFAGKMITATFMTHQTYEAKFPSSK